MPSILASESDSGPPNCVERVGSPDPHVSPSTVIGRVTVPNCDGLGTVSPERVRGQCSLIQAQAKLGQLPEGERGTSLMISNVAAKLVEQGRLSEAEALYREMLAARREKLGNRDPDTLAALGNLALSLRLQGKLAEAEPLCRESLAASREVLGNDDQGTMVDAGNYGKLLLEQGKLGEAEQLLVEVVAWWRKKHGNGGFCNGPLVELLREQGRLPEARQELGTLAADMRAKFGPHRQATLEAEAIAARLRYALGHRALSVIAAAVEPDGTVGGGADLRAAVERMGEFLGAAHPYTVKWQLVLDKIELSV